ncbi:Uncharacterised protein [Mycoplasmoides pneumoniae]|uniref:Uncharacterized protein n=1 Tax=Mycoplasmoides pneumoniae TaxID=2104 RepID=A0AB38W8J8_MYCPM|nr:Uncharacterised protein [Mycoplasmoides pneumoniae]
MYMLKTNNLWKSWKSQNLHNLELETGATKPPVVDLASYLHYLILNHK